MEIQLTSPKKVVFHTYNQTIPFCIKWRNPIEKYSFIISRYYDNISFVYLVQKDFSWRGWKDGLLVSLEDLDIKTAR